VPKQDKPLEKTKRAFRSASTSDDPVIRWGTRQQQAHGRHTAGALPQAQCGDDAAGAQPAASI
jgi:hypothetical protein